MHPVVIFPTQNLPALCKCVRTAGERDHGRAGGGLGNAACHGTGKRVRGRPSEPLAATGRRIARAGGCKKEEYPWKIGAYESRTFEKGNYKSRKVGNYEITKLPHP